MIKIELDFKWCWSDNTQEELQACPTSKHWRLAWTKDKVFETMKRWDLVLSLKSIPVPQQMVFWRMPQIYKARALIQPMTKEVVLSRTKKKLVAKQNLKKVFDIFYRMKPLSSWPMSTGSSCLMDQVPNPPIQDSNQVIESKMVQWSSMISIILIQSRWTAPNSWLTRPGSTKNLRCKI